MTVTDNPNPHHMHMHNEGSESNSLAHLSISSPDEQYDDDVDGRFAFDGESAMASHQQTCCDTSAGPVMNSRHRSHPNETEDRRSSLRGSAKRLVLHSPRWRDQQEAVSSSSHSLDTQLSHGGSGVSATAHQEQHNDAASQTSHTDSHHSSSAALSDGELLQGPFKDRRLQHLKFTSAHHHNNDNDSSSEGRLTPSHNNLSIHPIIHSETRFPTSMGYAPSEAAKSDIATVCSGSVIEDIDKDIDMASVASGEFPNVSSFSAAKTPSGGSTGMMGAHMHVTTATTPTAHHHHPQSFTKHNNNSNNNHTASRGVEFAAHTHTYPFHQNAPSHYLSTSTDTETVDPSSASAADRSLLNDMGPPLSRTLLLVATAAANGETTYHRHVAVEGSSTSRAGSVRSFSTGEAPSDVVAHVDTDDCGGSINLSEVSQEDHKEANLDLVPGNSTIMEPQNLGDAQTSVATSTNGRVSPGGTIYKGKGVRRYQGRYMKLPLKRFHQGEFIETMAQSPLQEGEELYLQGDSDNDIPAQPPQWDDWSNSGYRSLSRSFSRSISPPPSRSRSRSRSESPRDNLRRRRPSWSPHRGSDRNTRRPMKGVERESPNKDSKHQTWSRPIRDSEPNQCSIQRNPSPLNDLENNHEGNDGRWHRDQWNNRGGSRTGQRRSDKKRKGSRSGS